MQAIGMRRCRRRGARAPSSSGPASAQTATVASTAAQMTSRPAAVSRATADSAEGSRKMPVSAVAMPSPRIAPSTTSSRRASGRTARNTATDPVANAAPAASASIDVAADVTRPPSAASDATSSPRRPTRRSSGQAMVAVPTTRSPARNTAVCPGAAPSTGSASRILLPLRLQATGTVR